MRVTPYSDMQVVNVKYFAWLRAKAGKGHEVVDPPDHVKTVEDLMTWLAKDRPGLAEAFSQTGVIRAAVNQDLSLIHI